MIEKSRLEELIKQGATVYYADRDVRFFIPIFLNKDFMIKGKELSHKENCVKDTLLEDLYETQDQAEWAAKYQRIQRTEYLDLPTWGEIKDFKDECIITFYAKNMIYGVVSVCVYGTFFWVENQRQEFLYEKFTEENYKKACDLCLKLFKGESDEKD